MRVVTRLCAAIAPLLLLSACLLAPGKFVSALDVRKDGSFTFTYKGEVIAEDYGEGMKGLEQDGSTNKDAKEGDASYFQIAESSSEEDEAAKTQAIADALSKEKGFRSVRVVDEKTLEIDYAISGRLDHSFIFPFNIDAQAVIPFVAVEVRKDGKVRVQAPGFGGNSDKPGTMGGMGDTEGAERRDGSFTLTTDADIVSQNQEDGAIDTPQGKTIVWKVTPLTRQAPMAVLKLVGGK